LALDIVSHKNLIEVQPMNQTEALDLLQKKLSISSEHKDMVYLDEALEFVPLAIVQAAYSIMRPVFFTEIGKLRTPFCSHGKYPLTIFDGYGRLQQTCFLL
jgi:hypothetical protein